MDLNAIVIYEVTNEALNYYRNKVRGNVDASDDLIRRKLSRNIVLGRLTSIDFIKHEKTYVYGQLRIVVKHDVITKLNNHPMNAVAGWKLDRKKYILINKKLGIS